MNNRAEHMRKVNELRSIKTTAMIYLLDDLEEGGDGDYGGYAFWDITYAYTLKGQLNSYRAQKIAQFLGQTINKQRLLKYSKPKGFVYDLSNTELISWLDSNEQTLRRYYDFHKSVVTNG